MSSVPDNKTVSKSIAMKITSFELKSLEKAVSSVVSELKKFGSTISGPIPLPNRKKRFSLGSSPHCYKVAAEQIEITKYTRLIVLFKPRSGVMNDVANTVLPYGVDVQINFIDDAA